MKFVFLVSGLFTSIKRETKSQRYWFSQKTTNGKIAYSSDTQKLFALLQGKQSWQKTSWKNRKDNRTNFVRSIGLIETAYFSTFVSCLYYFCFNLWKL